VTAVREPPEFFHCCLSLAAPATAVQEPPIQKPSTGTDLSNSGYKNQNQKSSLGTVPPRFRETPTGELPEKKGNLKLHQNVINLITPRIYDLFSALFLDVYEKYPDNRYG
jgi:hypothetical protein